MNVEQRPPPEYRGFRPGDAIDVGDDRYLCTDVRRDSVHHCEQGEACRRAWLLELQFFRPIVS